MAGSATTSSDSPAQPGGQGQREPRDLDKGGAARELRLAVVCYGGVSLAIYMHGVTRELHSLVRASAALDAEAALYAEAGLDAKANLELNPFEHDQTEYTYWWALRELWRGPGNR